MTTPRRVRVYTCMHCGLTQKKRSTPILQCAGCFVVVRADEVIGWLEDERKVLA